MIFLELKPNVESETASSTCFNWIFVACRSLPTLPPLLSSLLCVLLTQDGDCVCKVNQITQQEHFWTHQSPTVCVLCVYVLWNTAALKGHLSFSFISLERGGCHKVSSSPTWASHSSLSAEVWQNKLLKVNTASTMNHTHTHAHTERNIPLSFITSLSVAARRSHEVLTAAELCADMTADSWRSQSP